MGNGCKRKWEGSWEKLRGPPDCDLSMTLSEGGKEGWLEPLRVQCNDFSICGFPLLFWKYAIYLCPLVVSQKISTCLFEIGWACPNQVSPLKVFRFSQKPERLSCLPWRNKLPHCGEGHSSGTEFCQYPVSLEEHPEPRWDCSPAVHGDFRLVRPWIKDPANLYPDSSSTETDSTRVLSSCWV